SNPAKPDGTACGSATTNQCDNADSCLGGACNPNYVAAGTSCSDGLGCTLSDACNGSGSCVGTPRNCDDGSVCTTDACTEPAGACQYTISGSCDIHGLVRYYRDSDSSTEPSTKPIAGETVQRNSSFEGNGSSVS